MPTAVQIHAYRSGIFQKFKVDTKDEEKTRKRLVAEGYVICQVEPISLVNERKTEI